uniref:MADF domain-containing protein n=1 Tax=Steinernema glaseri TaxID=37863 RepID=A0A1I8A3X2_9BILA
MAFNPRSYEENAVVKLIDLVRRHTVIWNRDTADIQKTEEKDAAWDRVAAAFSEEHNWSASKMKTCWKTLVRYYRLQKEKGTDGKYIRQLEFLRESVHASRSYKQQGTSTASLPSSDDAEGDTLGRTYKGDASDGLANEETSSEDGAISPDFREQLTAALDVDAPPAVMAKIQSACLSLLLKGPEKEKP